MKTVERVASQIPQIHKRCDNGNVGPRGSTGEIKHGEAQSSWEDIVSSGVTFVGKLANALRSGGESSLIEKDRSTGRHYLKIPLKDEKLISTAAQFLSSLEEAFGKFSRGG